MKEPWGFVEQQKGLRKGEQEHLSLRDVQVILTLLIMLEFDQEVPNS